MNFSILILKYKFNINAVYTVYYNDKLIIILKTIKKVFTRKRQRTILKSTTAFPNFLIF